jgi:hypothetical protein
MKDDSAGGTEWSSIGRLEALSGGMECSFRSRECSFEAGVGGEHSPISGEDSPSIYIYIYMFIKFLKTFVYVHNHHL